MSITGEPDGEPMKVGVGVADVVCGLYATTAILAALRHRDQTGAGQHIDIGLADTTVSWLVNAGTNYLTSGQEQPRLGNQHPNIVPYQVFEASDGHMIVAAGNDGQYARFCQIIGRSNLATDPRFTTNISRIRNRDELIEMLSLEIRKHPKHWLVTEMEKNNVPGGSINIMSEVFASEQVKARDMKISMPAPSTLNGHIDLIGNHVKFSETPVSYRHAPPTCGEHTGQTAHRSAKEPIPATRPH